MSEIKSVEDFDAYFRSGNGVPVGRATIPASDWQRVKSAIDALRAENEALRAELEWKPIETAPRDATVVLLWTDDGFPVAGGYAKYDDPDFQWEGWIYADPLLSEADPEGPLPTHWMPLPPRPEARYTITAAGRAALAGKGKSDE